MTSSMTPALTSTATPLDVADARRPGTPSPAGERGLPFRTLLLVEARKLVDTLAGRWLLISIVGATALTLLIMWFAAEPAQLTFANALGVGSIAQMLLLPVLGIMAATAEWSQRTGLVTFALEPRRHRVAAAKLITAIGLGLLAVLVSSGVAAAFTAAAHAAGRGDGSWTLSWAVLGGLALSQILAVAQGVGFGLVLANTPTAIVLYFLLPTAWSLLGMWEKAASVAEWADINTTTAPLIQGAMTSDAWARLGVSAGIWVILPVVAGIVLLRRREIS